MKKLGLIGGITVLAILLICIVPVAKAQQVQHDINKGQNKRVQGGLNALNLSDDQKAKIQKLTVPHLKEMKDLKNQLVEKRAHLNTLRETDNPDMNALNKTIDEISGLSGTMMKKGMAHQQEVRKLLTDEQRLRYDAMQNNKGPKDKMKNKTKGQMKGNMQGKRMDPKFQGDNK
jgi:Spy/CpxP family protein refolding chaperone